MNIFILIVSEDDDISYIEAYMHRSTALYKFAAIAREERLKETEIGEQLAPGVIAYASSAFATLQIIERPLREAKT